MQILEGDLLRKMYSSRTKKRTRAGRKREREIKGRKKEREQEEKENASRKKREIKGRKKEREQEETCPEMSSVCKHPKPSPCIK